MTSLRSIATAIAFSLAAAPLYGQARTITLDEALKLAEENNPQMVGARGQLRIARHDAKKLMFWLPSINFGAGAGLSYSRYPRFDPVTNDFIGAGTTSKSYSFSVTGSFEQWGLQTSGRFNQKQLALRQQEIQFSQQQLNIAASTTIAYNAARQAADQRQVALNSLQRAEDQLAIVVVLMRTLSKSVADSLQAELAIANARVDVLTANATLASSEAALAQTVGMDGRISAVSDTTEPPIIEIDEATLIAEAKKDAPSVRLAQLSVRSARLGHSLNRTSIFPGMALSFGRYSNAANPDYHLSTSNSIGLSLGMTVPLYNAGRKSQLMQSSLGVESAEAGEADAIRGIEASVIGAVANLNAAAERIKISKLALEAARANAEIQRRRYQLGTIDIQILKQAEEDLNAQENAVISSRYQYINSKVNLEALIGRKL